MIRIQNPQYISGILYQSMLKTSSGAYERPVVFTSQSDGLQRPFHAFIWAARRTPKSVILFQYRLIAIIT